MSKILVDRSVLEQALEALEMMGTPSPSVFLPYEIKSWQTVQAALHAALEQPPTEQEPIGEAHEWGVYDHEQGRYTHCVWDARVVPVGTKLYIHPQTQGKQEPYLWHDPVRDQFWTREDAQYMDMSGTIPLYTHPQPPRQPLTEEMIESVWHQWVGTARPNYSFVRAIERAHGIKE